MVTIFDHFTRLVNDLVKRLDHYEETQQELLTGFPEKYASREDLEKIREDAVELQTAIIGRDRFEALEKQVSENTGRRTTLIATAGFVSAVVLAILGWNNSQISEVRDVSNQNRKEISVLNNQITSLQIKLHGLEDKLQIICRLEARETHAVC